MSARLPLFLRRRPPPPALAWAAEAFGPGSRVTSLRRLRGASSASVHALAIEDGAGRRGRAVLRRFVRSEWLAIEPDLAAKEARVLRGLETTSLPAPRLLRVDEDGRVCGAPAVLMSLLPGRIELEPATLAARLDVLAEALAAIHAVPCSTVEGLQPHFLWADLDTVAVPAWTNEPAAWRRLHHVVRRPPPAGESVFLHRDYHPANVLWARGRLSGITDWVNACCGPPSVDVAHCCGNLAVLEGVEAAVRFRALYEAASGRRAEPYWFAMNLAESPSSPDGAQWADLGLGDLTAEVVRARRDAWATSVAGLL